jgi:YggT family protein
MAPVALVIGYVMEFLAFAIFARSMLSWFPIDRNGPIVRALVSVTEPVLEPLRRVIPPIGMIDITPMIAMIALFVIAQQLLQVS